MKKSKSINELIKKLLQLTIHPYNDLPSIQFNVSAIAPQKQEFSHLTKTIKTQPQSTTKDVSDETPEIEQTQNKIRDIGDGAGKLGTFLTTTAAEVLGSGMLVDPILDSKYEDYHHLTDFIKTNQILDDQKQTKVKDFFDHLGFGPDANVHTLTAAGAASAIGTAAGAFLGPFIGVPLHRIGMLLRNLGRRIQGKPVYDIKYRYIKPSATATTAAVTGGILSAVKGGLMGAAYGPWGIVAGIGIGLALGATAGSIGATLGTSLYNGLSYPFRSTKNYKG